MPRIRVLSGDEIIKILQHFGFLKDSQKGSHVKLVRLVGKHRETLTIPRHKDLDRGTTLAIYRQAGRFVSEQELHPHFYNE